MKKFLFILSAGTILLLSSCSSKKEAAGMSDTAKKNTEVNNAIMKMFETGDYSKVDEYIAKDAVDHGGPKGDLVGIDSIKGMFTEMQKMMTNMKNDIVRSLADDEYVMCWVKGSATAKMDLPEWGMKAGESHTGESIEVSKYKDGKVVEHWTFMDVREMTKMMAMMGNMDPNSMPPPPAKDTTKKMDNK